jgi:hypothetical protein
MERDDQWDKTSAKIIYESYPVRDLLPIDPPADGESIGSFAQRAEAAGDTLFLFLCREAKCDGAAEYMDLLDKAISDIENVRDAFQDYYTEGKP